LNLGSTYKEPISELNLKYAIKKYCCGNIEPVFNKVSRGGHQDSEEKTGNTAETTDLNLNAEKDDDEVQSDSVDFQHHERHTDVLWQEDEVQSDPLDLQQEDFHTDVFLQPDELQSDALDLQHEELHTAVVSQGEDQKQEKDNNSKEESAHQKTEDVELKESSFVQKTHSVSWGPRFKKWQQWQLSRRKQSQRQASLSDLPKTEVPPTNSTSEEKAETKPEKNNMIQKHRKRTVVRKLVLGTVRLGFALVTCYVLVCVFFVCLTTLVPLLPLLPGAAVAVFSSLRHLLNFEGLLLLTALLKLLKQMKNPENSKDPKKSPAAPAPKQQHFTFELLNDRYDIDQMAFEQAELQSLKAQLLALEGKANSSVTYSALKSLLTRVSRTAESRRIQRNANNNNTEPLPVPADECLRTLNTTINLNSTISGENSLTASTQGNKTIIDSTHGRVFVIKWPDSSIDIDGMEFLREAVDFLLQVASSHSNDEVVMLLDSPGGSVSRFGLGAAQLRRIRNAGITLTVCVDEVAASGGYMLASVGNKILASPFALVGSIGVLVTPIVNVQKALEKYGVESYEFSAGKHKMGITPIGRVTSEKMDQMQKMLDTVHNAFKNEIKKDRPLVDIDLVSTGEIWLACDALKLNLVDQLLTSDEYISKRLKEAAVYRLRHYKQPVHWFKHFLSPPKKDRLMSQIRLPLQEWLQHFLKFCMTSFNKSCCPGLAIPNEEKSDFYRTNFLGTSDILELKQMFGL